MIITLETSMFFTVCIQIFVVSSMFSKKKIINESSLKEQWNMKDSEVNTSKTKKIKKPSIEIVKASNMYLQRIINESSTKQQGNISESEVNTTKTIKIKKFPSKLSRFQNLSSKNHQRIINQAARKHQCFGD